MTMLWDPWIVSDTHFLHKNIIKYCNRPSNWESEFVHHWRTTVKANDTVIHLGDLALGNFEAARAIVSSLPGHIYLLKGNHDHYSNAQYERMGIRTYYKESPVPLYLPTVQVRILLSHEPMAEVPDGCINLHGHVHNNPYEPVPGGVNLSIECMDYRLIRLSEVLERIADGRLPKAK